MFQTVNNYKSFKDYLLSYYYSSEQISENDWGWFVDIENQELLSSCQNSYYIKQQTTYKTPISVPPTITEVPSIKSMKSYSNLYESSKSLELSDSSNQYEDTINKNYSNQWIVNATCILSVIIIFII